MIAIRWKRPACLAALMLCATMLASAQIKVAAVNLQKALQDTAEIKQAEADLKAKFGPRQEELANLEKEIAKLTQDYEANQSKFTEPALAEMAAKIQLKQRQLQRNSEGLQNEVNRERQDILQRVGQRLQEVVKKVSEEKGLDLVVDGANLLYFKPTMDISADVTAAYDKAYPSKK
ncbi:OmpH family outer membrane protein [uncultured Paludibaculum sp.]|uniref:OmpH family outer membrane protein n=1 Tax=uncultured Paludibaculum sp. TaxID=1765020 RepID=UPI002AABB4C8|nr:OmpH family outer membrane protein [uncultured Paludibaculum sp.]